MTTESRPFVEYYQKDGRPFHDRDGMTTERAESLVALVVECQNELREAFFRMDAAAIPSLKLRIDNINREARRLNQIRRQQIEGWGNLQIPLIGVRNG